MKTIIKINQYKLSFLEIKRTRYIFKNLDNIGCGSLWCVIKNISTNLLEHFLKKICNYKWKRNIQAESVIYFNFDKQHSQIKNQAVHILLSRSQLYQQSWTFPSPFFLADFINLAKVFTIIMALIIPPLYADYVYEDKLSALKRFM